MKTNLSYFQHSTTTFLDRDILRLITNYQGNGYLIYLFLKSEIFRDQGYFLKYDEFYHEYVNYRLPFLDKELVSEVVMYSLELGLFDKDIFIKHKILTSKSIQEDFIEIMKRMNRKFESIIPELDLLETTKSLPKVLPQSLNDLSKSSDELPKHSDELPKPSEELDKTSKSLNTSSKELDIPSNELIKPLEELGMNESGLKQSSEGENYKNKLILERKRKEMKQNEIYLSLNRDRLFEIFFIEKNYPVDELEKFINHYSKTGWIDKNGHKIVDILATAKNWKQIDTPIKFHIPSRLHEKWKNVWTIYERQLGFEKAKHLLSVTPKVQFHTMTFICSVEVKDLCEDNIDYLKFALRTVFGNKINLEYDLTNHIAFGKFCDQQGFIN